MDANHEHNVKVWQNFQAKVRPIIEQEMPHLKNTIEFFQEICRRWDVAEENPYK